MIFCKYSETAWWWVLKSSPAFSKMYNEGINYFRSDHKSSLHLIHLMLRIRPPCLKIIKIINLFPCYESNVLPCFSITNSGKFRNFLPTKKTFGGKKKSVDYIAFKTRPETILELTRDGNLLSMGVTSGDTPPLSHRLDSLQNVRFWWPICIWQYNTQELYKSASRIKLIEVQ